MAWVDGNGTKHQGAPPNGPDGKPTQPYLPDDDANDNVPGGPTQQQINNNPAPVKAALDASTARQQEQDQKAAADQAAAAKLAAYNAHFQYGGTPGGAAAAAQTYQDKGQYAQTRQGDQINTTNADVDRNTSLGDRGNQNTVAGLLMSRANGSVPSVAEMQADRQIGQANAAQSSAAASARGPAALALAQQGAAANTATLDSGISNQAQINGAQEQQANTVAAANTLAGIRGQDASQQGQDFGQAKSQADINAAQRAENDRYSQGLYQDSIGINNSQLQAQGNQIGIETGATTAQGNRDSASNTADANRNSALAGTIAGGALTGGAILGSAVLGSGSKGSGNPADNGGALGNAGQGGGPENYGSGSGSGGDGTDFSMEGGGEGDPNDPNGRADGGPTQAGRPYLVGERGPEIIIPREDGYVLTAEQSHPLLHGSDYRMKQEIQPLTLGGVYADDIAPKRPVSDKEAARLASMFGGQKESNAAMLMGGPAVGDGRRREAEDMLESQRSRNDAMLAAGPSVGGHVLEDGRARDAEDRLATQRESNAAMLMAGPAVRRVADGTADSGYNTTLTDGSKGAYERWLDHNAPGDAGGDYDYRGAFAAGQARGGANGHFTDQFKKPNHETFSDESQYAPASPETAGHWAGDRYEAKGPPAWLRQNVESEKQSLGSFFADDDGSERYAYSDDRTKVVAAQREAFRAGLNHANQTSDTGTEPAPPTYMAERAERRQPAATERRAATPLARVDPEPQRAENARSQGVYNRSEAAGLAGPALGFGATLASNYGRTHEDLEQYDRNLESKQAPGAVLSSGPVTYSDERTKTGMGAERNMGLALAQGFKPYQYEYKPGFAEKERQEPGEKNVGPMAQDMASNSITGSAVKRAPNGLLMVDLPKATKVNSAGIGYLAQKQEEMQPSLASALAGVDKLHERVRELERGGRQ